MSGSPQTPAPSRVGPVSTSFARDRFSPHRTDARELLANRRRRPSTTAVRRRCRFGGEPNRAVRWRSFHPLGETFEQGWMLDQHRSKADVRVANPSSPSGQRDITNIGYLLQAHAFDEPQNEYGTLLELEPIHHRIKGADRLHRFGVQRCRPAVLGLLGRSQGARALATTKPFVGNQHRDAGQPVFERAGLSEVTDSLEGANEYLVQEVGPFDLLGAHDARQDPLDVGSVAVEKSGPSMRISIDQSDHQTGIVLVIGGQRQTWSVLLRRRDRHDARATMLLQSSRA